MIIIKKTEGGALEEITFKTKGAHCFLGFGVAYVHAKYQHSNRPTFTLRSVWVIYLFRGTQ